MRAAAANTILKFSIPAAVLMVAAFLVSSGLLQVSQYYILVGAALATVFIVTFMSPEVGLYILILSMLLSPEVILGNVAQAGPLSRGVTLRLDDFLIAVIGLSWFARTALEKDLGLLRRTPLNGPIFGYICIMIVSTGLGYINGRVAGKAGFFFTLKIIEYFVIYFMTVNLVRDRDQVRKIIAALIITCILVSIHGIAQIPSGQRVTAPFEGQNPEPNTFGGYLVFMLSLILTIALTHERPRVRRGMFLMAVIIVPLIFSFSRSSMVGLIGMSLALLAFSRRRLVLVLGLVVVVLAGPAILPQKFKERVTYTWDQPYKGHPLQIEVFGITLDTSTSQRVVAYQRVSQDWLKHPVLGTGITGYRFIDAQFARVLAETGLAGLLVFLWLLVSVFRVGHRTYRYARTPLFRCLGLGLAVGLCGLAAHGLGTNTFIIVRIMEPFWLTTGVVARLLDIEAEEEQAALDLALSPSIPALAS